jgi:hypothetical protein
MRNIILLVLVTLGSSACRTMTEAEYVALMNADSRVWPPVVVGQSFPIQMMNDPE